MFNASFTVLRPKTLFSAIGFGKKEKEKKEKKKKKKKSETRMKHKST